MKMIYVTGDDDYAAIEFEKKFKGRLVSDIIQEYFVEDNEYEGDFEMEVYDFSEIDPKFLEFLRHEILDYDQLKHSNYYFENQTVR